MNRLLASIITFLVPAGAANAQFIDRRSVEINNGTCIVVMQVDNIETGAVNMQGMTCPQEDGKSFAIRYIWLNAIQISFLLQKYADKNMAFLLGSNLNVSKNSVLSKLETLYERYGARSAGRDDTTPNTFYVGKEELIAANDPTEGMGVAIETGMTVQFAEPFSSLPVSVRSSFRLPTFEQQIIWPDTGFLDQLGAARGWPQSYRYYYNDNAEDPEGGPFLRQFERGAKRKHADVADRVAACMTLHRFVSESEFRNYWATIDALENDLDTDEAENWEVEFDGPEQDELIKSIVGNPAYDFHSELTREFWPADYLLVTGALQNGSTSLGCATEPGGVAFHALPRTLAAKVAVITPLNDQVVVKSARGRADRTGKLRAELKLEDEVEIPFGDVVLRKDRGDSLIVPLSIELKYDVDEVPFAPVSRSPTEIEGIFTKYPQSPFLLRHCEQVRFGEIAEESESAAFECFTIASKELGEFSPHQTATVTPTYFYGEAFSLESINVNGTVVDVRESPDLALVASNSGDYGSCPFLYFEDADGNLAYYGRILVGAVGLTNMATERIPFPHGTRRIVIREIEPEVTYINHISFGTSSFMPVADRQLRLGPRDQISIPVPPGETEVTISGYYELLN